MVTGGAGEGDVGAEGAGQGGAGEGDVGAEGAGQGGAGDPAAFHFVSRWELAIPRERIWDTLVDFHTWPLWWPGLDGVIETIHGDPDGIGQRATSSWHGPVGYSLEIAIESVERVYPEFLRGAASGDVVGEGVWRLSPVLDAAGPAGDDEAGGATGMSAATEIGGGGSAGGGESVPGAESAGGFGSAGGTGWTEVLFDWNVRANRRWMEFLAPVARPLFAASHDHVMKRGAEGLATHLGCEIRDFSAHAK